MLLGRQKGEQLDREAEEDFLRTTLVDLIGLLATPGVPAPLLGASALCPKVLRSFLELGLANEKGFPHHGRIDYVDLGVDAGSGTIQVRGIFPNPKPGSVTARHVCSYPPPHRRPRGCSAGQRPMDARASK
jgi:hypothetical protein